MSETDDAAAPPARRRRKEARPAEIVEIALDCFLERGFEATRLDEVARRAGVAKGTVYLYFATKEDLFRAVVRHVTEANLGSMAAITGAFDGKLEELVPALLAQMAETVVTSRAPAVARMVLREIDRFPDLAGFWYHEVAAPLMISLEAVLRRAQERGAVREGDPRLQVLSILGPISAGIQLGDLLDRLGEDGIDLPRLAAQHAEVVLAGLRRQPTSRR